VIHLVRDLLLVCVGLSLEVVYTALCEHGSAGNWRLQGYTYLWMIPIYATVYPALRLLSPYTSSHHWLARGAFYVALIWAVEYASGWLLRKLTGECPWERNYYPSRWHVHGLIRLDMAPAWLGASLLYESVYRLLVTGRL
jgi:hypothetical protein